MVVSAQPGPDRNQLVQAAFPHFKAQNFGRTPLDVAREYTPFFYNAGYYLDRMPDLLLMPEKQLLQLENTWRLRIGDPAFEDQDAALDQIYFITLAMRARGLS